MENKTTLRIMAKTIRKGLDMKKISLILVQKISETAVFEDSNHVMLYHPMKNEVDLTDLIEFDKQFYFPKTVGENLLVCPYKKGEPLVEACFGVKEPLSQPVESKILDLIIVPALMADRQNYRLGYGKGYYDRFLKTCCAKTLCAIPKELLVEKICVEAHDQKIDLIICT